MIPKRIQRKREAGWTKPKGAVYVGRPGKFGNPWAPKIIPGWATMTRQNAVDDFRQWLRDPKRFYRDVNGGFTTVEESEAAHKTLMDGIPALKGKDLMCWCPESQPCHGDVLLEIANGEGE